MDFMTIAAYDTILNKVVWMEHPQGSPKMEHIIKSSDQKLALLTATEAAEYLRVSLSTLNRIERRGLLNPLRTPGGHRRYTLKMLNECLMQHNAGVEAG